MGAQRSEKAFLHSQATPGYSRVVGLRQDLESHAEAGQLPAHQGAAKGISEALQWLPVPPSAPGGVKGPLAER